MPNDTSSSSFPETQKDVSNLKQTATDAASDLGNAAAKHTDKAKRQLKDLAEDVQDEGSEQLDKVKGKANDVLEAAKNYISERPLATVAAALFVGYVFGRSRRS